MFAMVYFLTTTILLRAAPGAAMAQTCQNGKTTAKCAARRRSRGLPDGRQRSGRGARSLGIRLAGVDGFGSGFVRALQRALRYHEVRRVEVGTLSSAALDAVGRHTTAMSRVLPASVWKLSTPFAPSLMRSFAAV